MSAEARLLKKLAEFRLEMAPAPEPKGLYRTLVVVGNLAYTSGHGPVQSDGTWLTGRLGAELDVEAGQHAAMLTGLSILATLRKALGSLDRVRRVVKVLGMINCTPEFDQQPAVLNGCSQLFADVFGPDSGVGVRSAVGVTSLPLGTAVEIEAVFEIAPAVL